MISENEILGSVRSGKLFFYLRFLISKKVSTNISIKLRTGGGKGYYYPTK